MTPGVELSSSAPAQRAADMSPQMRCNREMTKRTQRHSKARAPPGNIPAADLCSRWIITGNTPSAANRHDPASARGAAG